MSTGGPPSGTHTGGKKEEEGLVSKIKDAIKPGSSSATRDNTQLPGGTAHESQDRGGGGVLNALKPGGDNMEGNSTLSAAREATQSMKSGASSNMPADSRGPRLGWAEGRERRG
ncbi:uncharacterized protein PG998_010168 [Apiospora kogelbergensis]|uniref:uncharacterized protein n=1 Tax=Apiospora kogelbergensis TaxID=1337665 RepID=UPI00312DCC70